MSIWERLVEAGRVIVDTFDRFFRHDGSAMAGSIAYSAILSIFPFLIFGTTLVGIYVGQERSDALTEALFEIAPDHVAQTLEPVVSEVVGKDSGSVLSLSALFAIFVASNAVESLRITFHRAYEVTEPGNVIIRRFESIGIVLLGTVVAALLGFSILLSPLIFRLITQFSVLPVPPIAGYISYGFGLVIFVGFLLLMHRWLPGRLFPFRRIWPGVVVTTVLWMLAASGFSIYLSATPTYTVTYGALAGVIITLIFFYLTGFTIILGAEFNAALHHRRDRAAVDGGRRAAARRA